jgi:Fe-S cluster biogenesis protein NfuA
MMSAEDREVQDRLRRVEGLVARLEACPDPAAREAARELVRVVLDLHAAGLARLLELIASDHGAGSGLVGRLARDGLVGSVLQLHGLHPESAQRRMEQALDRLRPRLRALGGDAELVEATAAAIRVRLRGDPSSGPELRRAVEEAVVAAAPDVDAVEIEEAWDRAPVGRVSLPLLGARENG